MCTICVSTVGVDGVVSTLFIMLRGNTYIYELQAGVRRCGECHMYVVWDCKRAYGLFLPNLGFWPYCYLCCESTQRETKLWESQLLTYQSFHFTQLSILCSSSGFTMAPWLEPTFSYSSHSHVSLIYGDHNLHYLAPSSRRTHSFVFRPHFPNRLSLRKSLRNCRIRRHRTYVEKTHFPSSNRFRNTTNRFTGRFPSYFAKERIHFITPSPYLCSLITLCRY